jgi:hypothetical protein
VGLDIQAKVHIVSGVGTSVVMDMRAWLETSEAVKGNSTAEELRVEIRLVGTWIEVGRGLGIEM